MLYTFPERFCCPRRTLIFLGRIPRPFAGSVPLYQKQKKQKARNIRRRHSIKRGKL